MKSKKAATRQALWHDRVAGYITGEKSFASLFCFCVDYAPTKCILISPSTLRSAQGSFFLCKKSVIDFVQFHFVSQTINNDRVATVLHIQLCKSAAL